MILSRSWLHDTVSCAAWNGVRKGVYLQKRTISAHDVSIKILRRFRAEHSCPHHNMFFKKACSVPSCFWVLWPTLSIISWIWIAGAVLCKNPKINFCYLRMLKTKWFLFRADQETTCGRSVSEASNQLPESPVSHGSSSQGPQCSDAVRKVRRWCSAQSSAQFCLALLSSAEFCELHFIVLLVAICISLRGEGVMREEDWTVQCQDNRTRNCDSSLQISQCRNWSRISFAF